MQNRIKQKMPILNRRFNAQNNNMPVDHSSEQDQVNFGVSKEIQFASDNEIGVIDFGD
jgi:hypothetical protein